MQSDTSSSKSEDKNTRKAAQASSAGRAANNAAKNKDAAKGGEKPPAAGGRSAWVLAFLAFILALIGMVLDFTLWQWGDVEFDEFDERIETVERGLENSVQDLVLPKVKQIKSEQSAMQNRIGGLESRVGKLDQGLDQTRLQTSDLADKVEGGRTRWKLLEIEGLLLAANERLQLHRDIAGSVEALSVASLRLARLNDPRLFKLRSQVTEEISTLESLPRPDIEGLALKLSSLMQQMPEWPLASNVPETFSKGNGEKEGGFSMPKASWEHFKSTMGETFDKLVTVRRSEGVYEPLMPPQQEFFLRQNLLLKLQTARLALLQRNTTAWRSSLEETQDWLKTFFASDAAAVRNALEQLDRMQRVELAWREPDISGSLTGLREYLRQLGRGETLPAAESLTTPPEQPATGEVSERPSNEKKTDKPAKPAPQAAPATPKESEPSAQPETKAKKPASDETAESSDQKPTDQESDAKPVTAPAGRLDDGLRMQDKKQPEAAK